MTRVIIYSGKGGTGKTTLSAATAALLARAGRRTLTISSDPAHSLADAFGMPISRERPTALAPGLYGLEVDTIYEWRRNLNGFQRFIAGTYTGRGVDSSTAAELANHPGMDEILALSRLMSEAKSGRWDAIVLDTAPTGNTLRLLAYPEMIIGGEVGKKMFRVYRSLANVARPFRRDLPDDSFFSEVGSLLDEMEALAQFLLGPDITLRLVLNPERLPLLETKRAYTFLNLYGLVLDAVLVNKILPHREDLGNYFDYWVQLQQGYLADIEASFSPTPIFKTILQGGEPIGFDQLLRVGYETFGQVDPCEVLYNERPIWMEQWHEEDEPAHYELCLRLPFLEADTVELERNGTDLTIAAGRLHRTVALPRILLPCQLGSHRYEDEVLRLEFRERSDVEQTETESFEPAA